MGCCSSTPSKTSNQGAPLRVGDKAPEVALTNYDGTSVDAYARAEKAGSPYLVVAFYRGGWCPFCNAQIRKFAEKNAEVEAAGGSVVFLAPQSVDEANLMQKKDGLPFPALQDVGNLVGRRFGVVFKVAPLSAVAHPFKTINASKDAQTGATVPGDNELPLPCAYIIRVSDRSIVWEFGIEKATLFKRPSVDTILKELKALSPA